MKNILLVHHNSEVIERITDYLFHDLFDLTIAGDASIARVLLAKKNYDMMITASLLPKSHGFTLAKFVHETYPETKVIILCDKLEDESYLREGYETGACEILEKSVGKSEFREKVMTHLGMNYQFLSGAGAGDSTRIDLKPLLFNLKSVQQGKAPIQSDHDFESIIKKVEADQEELDAYEIELE